MENPLKEIPLRQINFIVFAVFALTLLASYLYLFKKPLKTYATLKQSRVFLESKVATGGNLAAEIKALEETVGKLTKSLHGEGSAIPAQKLIAHNIERLDGLSNRHAIRLESVKPDSSRTVEMFEELPLSIRVSGSYFNLYQWLHEVEKELGPMVVKQFDLLPALGDQGLTMNLQMVSYIPVEQ